jgi:hypothetical protein
MANTLGCVFAYDSYTSLDTIADNLREINEQRDSREWIDLVAVLGKGTLAYAIQFPLSKELAGWFGGPTEENFLISPVYVHLVKHSENDLALNQFFVKLMAHLMFFRKRTTLDLEGLLGPGKKEATTIQGYQYNLGRKLVPAEATHRAESFQNPKIRLNLYSRADRQLVGQVCFLPWQDGAVITCSVRFDPRIVFEHYFRTLKQQQGKFLQAGPGYNMWFSSVLPISESEFVAASEEIHKDLVAVRDSPDDNPPSFTLPDTGT